MRGLDLYNKSYWDLQQAMLVMQSLDDSPRKVEMKYEVVKAAMNKTWVFDTLLQPDSDNGYN